jgi:poly-gamma-glutamate capsule biosynthesis protein CapA/YwtB (metallophosphatase superfamily)
MIRHPVLISVLYCLVSAITFLEPIFAQQPDQDEGPFLKIVFVGDVMLDGGPGHTIACGKDPFVACKQLFEGADYSIANLECVLGEEGELWLKPYTFRAASNSPRYLKKYFQAVCLANNHSMDFGPEGLVGMLKILEQEKLPYFGAGRNLQAANHPLVFESKGQRIAVIGFNEFNAQNYAAGKDSAGSAPLVEAAVRRGIVNAREKLHCDHVVLFLHWGEELIAEPRADQRAMARKWIDLGATAVLGAHPHITQTIEYHRGRPIVYSLGNFAFDYFPPDPPEWTGWVATLLLSKAGAVDLQIRSVTLDPTGCPHPTKAE